MPLHEYTPGFNLGRGIEPVNPIPVDSYSGPYSAGTTTDAVNLAYTKIPSGARFLSMEVRILAPDPDNAGQTLAYKYWFRGSTATLEEFSAGGGGEVFDSTQSYTWTAPQYFSSGFSAGGGVTFTSLARFAAGLSASGATLGTLVVNNGISAGGGITFTSDIQSLGKLTISNTVDINGPFLIGRSNFSAGEDIVFVCSSTATNGGQILFGANSSGVLHSTPKGSIKNLGLPIETYDAANKLYVDNRVSDFSVTSFNGATGEVTGVSFGENTFTGLNQFQAGISAAGATIGTLIVHNGISASGATFANNVYVGGTLSVEGNFYVAGTLTTVNESELLIQDKYLVLGSTLSSGEFAVGAGIYIGSTTSPIASFTYNNTDPGRWVSDKPIYVNNDLVVTSGNISAQTGITAENSIVEFITTTGGGTLYSMLFAQTSSTTGNKTRKILMDIYSQGIGNESVLYNAGTNTLIVGKLEAIVDGGTW